MRLAVIEDEPKISNIIKDYFEAREHEVIVFDDGFKALEEINTSFFDIIFLDIMLPKMNGFEVCEGIRRKSQTPIVFLTALPNEEFQLKAYRLGAIDYITKPFSLSILYAKAQALLQGPQKNNLVSEGSLVINVDSHQVTLNGQEIYLAKKEFNLLLYLLRNKGVVRTRENIMDAVWKDEYDVNDRSVDTHIKILRKKLGSLSSHIKTIPKEGYKWES